jgi:Cu/Ag efflux pump CusA
MTASIAVFSLVPMLLAGGAGSEIQKPLATVVVGGLITSTLLTLLIIYEKAFQVKSTHSSVLSGRSSETLRRSRASGRQIRIL